MRAACPAAAHVLEHARALLAVEQAERELGGARAGLLARRCAHRSPTSS